MRKTWLVAATTYRRRVRSTAFLLLTFGIPLLMVIAGAVAIMVETRGRLPRIGTVDRSGQLAAVESVALGDDTLQLTSYPDLETARRALDAGDIAGYLVIPEDYFESGRPTYYGEDSPGAKLESAMKVFMRQAMRPDAPAWALARLENPSRITYVARGTGERIAQGPALVIRLATPAFLAVIFVLSVFTSANQMGSAVVREKEHRAMEMVITSLSPRDLVVGKVLGMTLLSVTQIAFWIAGALLGIGLALLGTLQIQDLSIPWSALLWAALLGIPAYFLYAVLGAGLGVIAGDKQQARQLAGMLGFLGMGPIYFMGAIIENLGGPLGVGLTLFPLTAPTIALFRMTLSQVPVWQLATSLAIIIVTLAASVWFVARIFRAAMLLYGQTLHPREILRALRQA
jgi:ABC-2 type transport system permease protein